VSLCGGTWDSGGWSSDDMVLGGGKIETIEWWREKLRLRRCFYSSGGCESGCPERVTDDGIANSMLLFCLERGGNRMKY
jgi:hypothetical protein